MKLTVKNVKFAYSYDRLSHVRDSHGKDMGDKNYFTCSDIMKVDNYDEIQFMRISDCINCEFICDDKFRYPKNLKQLVFCPYSFGGNYADDMITPVGFPDFPDGLEELILYAHHYIIKHLPNALKYFSCEGSKYIKFECELPYNLIEFNCSGCYIGLHVYGDKSQGIYTVFWPMSNRPEVHKTHPNYPDFMSPCQEKLPNLPQRLEILNCSNNFLVELPELPSTLRYIDVRHNDLLDLPVSIKNCNLADWDDSDEAFDYYFTEYNIHGQDVRERLRKELGKVINPLFNFKYHYRDYYFDPKWYDDLQFETRIINGEKVLIKLSHLCIMIKRINHYKAIPVIENWFLECKYNPKYGYCQRRLQSQYDEMYEDKIEQNITN